MRQVYNITIGYQVLENDLQSAEEHGADIQHCLERNYTSDRLVAGPEVKVNIAYGKKPYRNQYVTEADKEAMLTTITSLTRLMDSNQISIVERSYYEEVRNKLNIISLAEPWSETKA
jgi:hypothetical protein